MEQIIRVIQMLHNASLMYGFRFICCWGQLTRHKVIASRLDDIEDNSKLRRGVPVVHAIYGLPSTINTATFVIFKALSIVTSLGNAEATNIFAGMCVSMEPLRVSCFRVFRCFSVALVYAHLCEYMSVSVR